MPDVGEQRNAGSFFTYRFQDRPYVNVIAQQFQRAFPDYVQNSGETLHDGSQILQVDTYPLTLYSVAAIQELHRHGPPR